MFQLSLSPDRRAADCGGSAKPGERARSFAGLGDALRSLFSLPWQARMRATPPDPLSDHLLRDIGLSRADVQALSL